MAKTFPVSEKRRCPYGAGYVRALSSSLRGFMSTQQEAAKVQRRCGSRLLRIWSVALAVLLVTAATACMSHPAEHAHDLPHPLLCLDAQGAIAERQTTLSPLAISHLLSPSPKFSAPVAWHSVTDMRRILGQVAQAHQLRWALHQLPVPILRALLTVLRL